MLLSSSPPKLSSVSRPQQRQMLLLYFFCAALASTILHDVTAVPIQLYGLNYNTRKGPDWDWDKCKSRAEVLTDLTLLKRLTNRIRILSLVDCNQGILVSSVARELNMELWLGLWVAQEDYVFEEEKGQLQYLIDQGVFDGGDSGILGVTVGSETIYRKDATVDEMIGHLNDVQDMLEAANINNMPLSIVETAPIYSANAKLREAVSVIMTNTFPFWESIPVNGAVDDLQVDIDWLLNLPESQGKDFVLGETGWPSDGSNVDVGVGSPESQQQYFQDAYCRIHVENKWAYYWFTGIDNAWRQEQDPDNTIEGNWGFFYADLTLKDHFKDFEFTCSDGVTYSFAELDLNPPTGFTNAPTALDPASCEADNGCAGLGLWGNCCPNSDGDFLGCCENTTPAATDEPNASTPLPSDPSVSTETPTVATTTKLVTTRVPTPIPTTSEPTFVPVATTTAPTMSPTEIPTSSSSISSESDTTTPMPTQSIATDEPSTSTSSLPTFIPTFVPTFMPTFAPTQKGGEELSPSAAITTPTQPPFDIATTGNAITSGSCKRHIRVVDLITTLFCGTATVAFLMSVVEA